jgi:hypothetical protein
MSGITFNYNQDTQDRIGSILGGLRVETPVLSNLANYWTNPVTFSVFLGFGLVKCIAMYLEVTSALDGNGTTLVFRYTGITPTVGIATMGSASASIASKKAGTKVMFTGEGQVAAGPAEGIAYLPAATLIGGQTGTYVNATWSIEALIAGGTQAATASGRYVMHYAPMTEGAYVVSAI